MIIAGTGHIGAMQRFCETSTLVWRAIGSTVKSIPPLQLCRSLCREAIDDARTTFLDTPQLGALVAFPNQQGAQLCEFSMTGFQPELKDENTWFVSMGSGQALGDPFLAFMRAVFWHKGPPTLKQGLFGAAWVLRQSIKFAPGLISEPIDIAVLQEDRAEMLNEQAVQYHLDIADQATVYFRGFDPTEIVSTTSSERVEDTLLPTESHPPTISVQGIGPIPPMPEPSFND